MTKQRAFALALALCLLIGLSASAAVYEAPEGGRAILSVGGHFAYVMDTAHRLLVFGDNQFGQLGYAGKTNFRVNTFSSKNREIDLTRVKDILSTCDYSFLWMDDDTVYGVGNNSYLPLTVKEGIYKTHVKLNLPEKPVQFALGFGHVLMLTENGEVYAWGRNSDGQVGNGKTGKTKDPQKLSLENIVQIAAGGKFSLALDRDGQLWGWGDNKYHQLSPEKVPRILSPVRIDTGDIAIAFVDAQGSGVVLLDEQGTVWTWGWNSVYQLGYETHNAKEKKDECSSSPAPVALPLPVVLVETYESQTMAVLEDGSMWSWGNNSYGQLGHGFSSRATVGELPMECWRGEDGRVALILNGSGCTMGMLEDGRMIVAGFNSKFGDLGDGTRKDQHAFSFNGIDLIP